MPLHLFTASAHLQPCSSNMALKAHTPALHRFKQGRSQCTKTYNCILGFKPNEVYQNIRPKVLCAMNMTAGQSADNLRALSTPQGCRSSLASDCHCNFLHIAQIARPILPILGAHFHSTLCEWGITEDSLVCISMAQKTPQVIRNDTTTDLLNKVTVVFTTHY
ncbi:hypothetical protein F0562_028637 [Nyssa sinensis]|uniref:Uncharacterized protein n=1 Tax=Nyssa sinensis TaxID=561372 RepID=A0A5J5B0I2_9ASTE|nr:hypothetical protein F0562_028637 [Nyssa sinensis]